MDASAVPVEFVHADLSLGSSTLPKMSQLEWAAEQRVDPAISGVIDILSTGKRLSYRVRQKEDREVQLMLRVQDQLVIDSAVLYRRRVSKGKTSFQLVLPKKYREMALGSLHDSVGHMGFERTIDLVRARFYWPKMSIDIDRKLRTCERCIHRKAKAERTSHLVNIRTSRPLELVCMDYLSLEPDGCGTKNILVITDHFTKYAVAVPTMDQKAKIVAKALWNNFFVHYGMPERLHSDQGRDFESTVIKDLCLLLGIRKTRTTPYHPRGNPVERFNRTLLEMQGTLEEEDKVRWRDHVQPLVHAYNCTKNETTGFSPYQLMFGRQPSLPIDVAFGLSPEVRNKTTHTDDVKKLKENLQESYKLAIEHSEKTALKNKERYDMKVRETVLEEGDRVLVKNVGVRGKHKIADRWSQIMYKVVKRINDSPVYIVDPVDANGPSRTLHRDLLLPCGFLAPSVKAEVVRHRQKTRTEPVVQSLVTEEKERLRGSYESEGDTGSDCSEEMPEFINPPSVTIVYDIPQTDVGLPTGDSVRSNLRPEAEIFQPERDWQQSHHEDELFNSLEDGLKGDSLIDLKEKGEDTSPEIEVEDVVQTIPEPEHGGEKELIEGETYDEVPDKHELKGSRVDNVQSQEESEVRWSARNRVEPDRLTYQTLGNPLTLVMHSLLKGLDQAFTKALDLNPVLTFTPSETNRLTTV